ATALMIIAQIAGPSATIPLTMLVALAAAVDLSALSPLVVPLFARALGLFLRANPVGTVTAADLRDGVRRSASPAAPLIVLVGILAALFGTAFSITDVSRRALARGTAAHFVVTYPVDETNRIANVQGVATTSVEVTVPFLFTLPEHDEDESGAFARASPSERPGRLPAGAARAGGVGLPRRIARPSCRGGSRTLRRAGLLTR